MALFSTQRIRSTITGFCTIVVGVGKRLWNRVRRQQERRDDSEFLIRQLAEVRQGIWKLRWSITILQHMKQIELEDGFYGSVLYEANDAIEMLSISMKRHIRIVRHLNEALFIVQRNLSTGKIGNYSNRNANIVFKLKIPNEGEEKIGFCTTAN